MRRGILIAVAALGLLAPSAAHAAGGEHATPFAARLAARTLVVHAAPSGSSRTVAVLRQFRDDFRPTVVSAIGRRSPRGRTWYRIRLAGRPNGRMGWVDGGRLEWLRSTAPVRLVIDLSERRLRVLRHGRVRRSFPVAVGAPDAPTPTGRFYLTAAWRPAEGLYGRWAIETSAGASITD